MNPEPVRSSLGEDNGDDHAIEAERLTEDENKDHADEDLALLCIGTDTSVTNNTNSESLAERSCRWGPVIVRDRSTKSADTGIYGKE